MGLCSEARWRGCPNPRCITCSALLQPGRGLRPQIVQEHHVKRAAQSRAAGFPPSQEPRAASGNGVALLRLLKHSTFKRGSPVTIPFSWGVGSRAFDGAHEWCIQKENLPENLQIKLFPKCRTKTRSAREPHGKTFAAWRRRAPWSDRLGDLLCSFMAPHPETSLLQIVRCCIWSLI